MLPIYHNQYEERGNHTGSKYSLTYVDALLVRSSSIVAQTSNNMIDVLPDLAARHEHHP